MQFLVKLIPNRRKPFNLAMYSFFPLPAYYKLNFRIRFLVARQRSYFDNKLFCNRSPLYKGIIVPNT